MDLQQCTHPIPSNTLLLSFNSLSKYSIYLAYWQNMQLVMGLSDGMPAVCDGVLYSDTNLSHN